LERSCVEAVGIFKYKYLVTYFHEKAVTWVNMNNGVGQIKMTDSFALRRFSFNMIKLENTATS
jgi:hypothetical protein